MSDKKKYPPRYGKLQLKFMELNSKYTSLSDAYESDATKGGIYRDMLEDLEDLESICQERRRY